MTFFYIFCKFLCWLSRKHLESSPLLVLCLLQYFVSVDEENPNLHRSVVEKEEFYGTPKSVLGTSERSSDITLRIAGLDYPRLSKSQKFTTHASQISETCSLFMLHFMWISWRLCSGLQAVWTATSSHWERRMSMVIHGLISNHSSGKWLPHFCSQFISWSTYFMW